jgi:hypothetical protein
MDVREISVFTSSARYWTAGWITPRMKSTSPSAKAVQVLVNEGLVKIVPGRGAYVTGSTSGLADVGCAPDSHLWLPTHTLGPENSLRADAA